jgi:hypothetical protein
VEHRRRRARLLRRVLASSRGIAAACPDDSELARYLDHTLTEARSRVLEDHFDACQLCRELAFLLAGLDPYKATRTAR